MGYLLELDNKIGVLAVQQPPVAFEKDWIGVENVEKSFFTRDFDSNLFDKNTPFEEIKHKVTSYMGEKLFMPRREDIFIGYDGSLDPEYVRVMQKSITHWRERGDNDTAHRFDMELVGMQRLATLVATQIAANPDDPARYIIGSDPGTTYATEEGAKTAIFAGEVVGFNDDGVLYRQLAIPVELLSLINLYDKLTTIGDFQQTAEILDIQMGELSPENLVAYPIALIAALDSVALEFGHESWSQITAKAENQLRLENDLHAVPRRERLIEHYSNKIFEALSEGRGSDYVNAIDESMRRVFAIEAGARDYLNKTAEEVVVMAEDNFRDTLAELLGVFAGTATTEEVAWFEHAYKTTIKDLVAYRSWMVGVFQSNPLARKALMTGCGGGRAISGIRSESMTQIFGYETANYSGMDVLQNDGYQGDLMDSGATVSSSGEDIVVTMSDGTTYILSIRDGWTCRSDSCGRVSNNQTKLRIGDCRICEHCDPNVHKAE